MDFDQGSRFQLTPPTLVRTPVGDGGAVVEVPDVWVRPSFLTTALAAADIGLTTVGPGEVGRLDILATRIYGSQFLDWILMAFNNVTDINWPPAGTVISFPSAALVFQALS